MKPLRIAVVGLGRMGHNHVRLLKSSADYQLIAVFDVCDELTTKVSREYSLTAAKSLDQLLEMNLDAAVVSCPTSEHLSVASTLLRRIPSLLIEKPGTASALEAKKLAKLADQTKSNIRVGFVERFNPAIQTVKEMIKTNNSLHSIELRRANSTTRITDVDVIADLMIHDIDIASILLGEVICILSAHGTSIDGRLVSATAVLGHISGKLSKLYASSISEMRQRSLQVLSVGSFIDADLLTRQIRRYRGIHMADGTVSSGVNASGIIDIVEVPPREPLSEQLKSFASSPHSNNTSLADLSVGIANLNIADLIREKISQSMTDMNDSKSLIRNSL